MHAELYFCSNYCLSVGLDSDIFLFFGMELVLMACLKFFSLLLVRNTILWSLENLSVSWGFGNLLSKEPLAHASLPLSSCFVFVGILFVPVPLQIPPVTRLRIIDRSKGSGCLRGLNFDFELYDVLSFVRLVMTFSELLTPLYLDCVDFLSSTGARAVTGLGGRPWAEGGFIWSWARLSFKF